MLMTRLLIHWAVALQRLAMQLRFCLTMQLPHWALPYLSPHSSHRNQRCTPQARPATLVKLQQQLLGGGVDGCAGVLVLLLLFRCLMLVRRMR